jgi:hypothetical protein
MPPKIYSLITMKHHSNNSPITTNQKGGGTAA